MTLTLALLTALASTPGANGAPIRVENRLFAKAERWFVSAGPTYLVRGDYYESPGLTLSAAYYLRENDGLELDVGGFASFLDSGASNVFEQSGLVPDAHRPEAQVMAGWRHSFGFGKVLMGEDSLWHFDVQGVARAGAILTDRGVDPTLTGGAEVLARFSDRYFGSFGFSALLSYEERTGSSVVFGLLPSLAVGVMW